MTGFYCNLKDELCFNAQIVKFINRFLAECSSFQLARMLINIILTRNFQL